MTDTVLRAMTNDGAFRVVVAQSTQTVRGVLEAQRVTGSTAKCFGDLVTGAVLIRETMAPNLRVQGILKGANDSGSLVADAHPSGSTRGLVQRRREVDLDLGPGSLLQFMRSLPGGRINQGVVEVPEGGGVSEALMAYMQVSEQVVSMITVGTVQQADGILSAGGYIVQLLPEVGRGPLMIMTERLEDFVNIDEQLRSPEFSPSWLLDQLLYGMEYTRLDESRLDFSCWCDELRLVSAIASLGRAEIEELVAEGEVLEITCDYCLKEYRIAPARLRGLIAAS
ncbi:MAG: Hsp33 family molecular chaperone HslO [Polyangiaceae bacterium]